MTDICPECKNDRDILALWAKEPVIIEMFLDEAYHQRTENHQKTLNIIAKCPSCSKFFKEE